MRNLGWANLKLERDAGGRSDTRGTVAGGNYTPPRGGAAQALVVASTPASCTRTTCVNPGPEAWTYGSASGYIYRYVTKSQDAHITCASPPGTDQLRITVAVTVNGPNAPKSAIVSSSIVIDPAAAPTNATQNVEPRHVDRRHLDRRLHRHDLLLHRHPRRRHLRGSLGEPRDAQHDRRRPAFRPAADDRPADPGLRLGHRGLLLDRRAPADRRRPRAGVERELRRRIATTAHRWVTPVINSSAAVTATGNAAMSMPTSVLSANVGQGCRASSASRSTARRSTASNQVSRQHTARLLQLPAARLAGRQRADLVPVPLPGDG